MNRTTEIRKSASGKTIRRTKTVEVLLFNIQMNNYGIPVNQIDQILEQEPADSENNKTQATHRADTILNLGDTTAFFFPSWIRLKPGLESTLASAILVIDGMSGIVDIPVTQIRKLPDLLIRHLSRPWIWGAALPEDEREKDIILLLDFNQPDPSTSTI